MHKNSFNPKSLIGNWHENRYTDEYDAQSDATSNTYLQNPCKWPQAGEQEISLSIFRSNSHLFLRFLSSAYNKYVPISRAVGNNPNYNKVSWPAALQSVVHPSRDRLLTWTLNDQSPLSFTVYRRSLATQRRTGWTSSKVSSPMKLSKPRARSVTTRWAAEPNRSHLDRTLPPETLPHSRNTVRSTQWPTITSRGPTSAPHNGRSRIKTTTKCEQREWMWEVEICSIHRSQIFMNLPSTLAVI